MNQDNTCRLDYCDKPVHTRKHMLCGAHDAQMRRGVEFRPIRVKGDTEKSRRACEFPECERTEEGKAGLCKPHAKQRRKGKGLTPLRARQPKGTLCSFPDCGYESKSTGLCSSHYAQKASGKQLSPVARRPAPGECAFDGCDKKKSTQGLCHGHYSQVRRGAPLTALKAHKVRTSFRSSQEVQRRDENGNKRCVSCEGWKPEADYWRTEATSDGFVSSCKQCMNEEPWNSPDAKRARNIRNLYNISIEEMDAIFISQGRVCASCGEANPGPKGWCIDHDHSCCPGGSSCGECVRGILCQPCNLALGIAKDDASKLRAMASYLETWASRESETLAA